MATYRIHWFSFARECPVDRRTLRTPLGWSEAEAMVEALNVAHETPGGSYFVALETCCL
jgi:hypothetical protein